MGGIIAILVNGTKPLLQQHRRRHEHPRLAPTHVWDLDGAKGRFLVIKITLVVTQIRQSPREDPAGEIDIVGMKMLQLEQGDDALGDAMHIDWIGPIVKIIRRSVLAEKTASIKIKSCPK